MPRFIVPRSTRTMLLTVSPRSFVKSWMSAAAGGLARLYGSKQRDAPVFVNVQVAVSLVAGWYQYVYFAGALQFASAAPSRPLARELTVAVSVVPGIVTTTGVTTGWAQIHGWSCSPEKTGPLARWFVIVRCSAGCGFPFGVVPVLATTWFSPSASPSTRPLNVPSARSANLLVTSTPSTVTRTSAMSTPSGTTTSTSASPPEIRSARFESTRISSLSPFGSLTLAGFAACSFAASAEVTVNRSFVAAAAAVASPATPSSPESP